MVEDLPLDGLSLQIVWIISALLVGNIEKCFGDVLVKSLLYPCWEYFPSLMRYIQSALFSLTK